MGTSTLHIDCVVREGLRRSPFYLGGTRNLLVVRWLNSIKAKGEIRTQFHHLIDIVPTILEAAKIPEPKSVKGHAEN
jgi:arylsulfatase A-like enzyme